MKSGSSRCAVLALLAMLFLAACGMPQLGREAAVSPDEGVPVANAGVVLKLPTFAPWITMSKEGSSRAVSAERAYLHSTRARIQLYGGPYGLLRKEYTINLSLPTDLKSDITTSTYNLQMPVGDFDLYVALYNDLVSTDTPIVCDNGQPITITEAGPNSFSTTLYPYGCTTLVPDTLEADTASFTLQQYGERWFSVSFITARSFFYCRTLSGDADMYLFTGEGAYIGKMTNPGTEFDSIQIDGTAYAQYLIGIFAYEASEVKVFASNYYVNGVIVVN